MYSTAVFYISSSGYESVPVAPSSSHTFFHFCFPFPSQLIVCYGANPSMRLPPPHLVQVLFSFFLFVLWRLTIYEALPPRSGNWHTQLDTMRKWKSTNVKCSVIKIVVGLAQSHWLQLKCLDGNTSFWLLSMSVIFIIEFLKSHIICIEVSSFEMKNNVKTHFYHLGVNVWEWKRTCIWFNMLTFSTSTKQNLRFSLAAECNGILFFVCSFIIWLPKPWKRQNHLF